MTVRVSAIVVNYNSAALTARAVASILDRQLSPGQTDVSVVDNTATESEREALEPLRAQGVRLILCDDNKGFGAACNIAYAESRGEYVLLLNPDAYLLPQALPRLVEFLDTRPQAGAVSPRAYLDNARAFLIPPLPMPSPYDELSRAVIEPWRSLVALRGGWQRRRCLRALRRRQAARLPNLSGGNVLLRRTAVESSGGLFDPGFFMYYEDADLFRRMCAKGFGLFIEPRAEVVHNFNQCHHEVAGQKRRFGLEAHSYYMHKYDPRGVVRGVAAYLRDHLPQPRLPHCMDLGASSQPPRFDVPDELRPAWALEISDSPYFVPAIARFGSGPVAAVSEEAWALLEPRPYYFRVGAAEGARTAGTWRVDRVRDVEH
jgi:GT2 family glycosyltransferase